MPLKGGNGRKQEGALPRPTIRQLPVKHTRVEEGWALTSYHLTLPTHTHTHTPAIPKKLRAPFGPVPSSILSKTKFAIPRKRLPVPYESPTD